WMCVNHSDTRHTMVSLSLSLFLLLGIFVPTASHFVLSCVPTHCAYNVMV
ncbi:hypothetical protein BHE74_00057572, partial [Ensete ventricosum]